MIRIKTVILVCLLFIAFKGAYAIRIASYNVYNYLSMDRYYDGKYRPNYPKPESGKKKLREIIQTIRPDILAIQEIGSLGHLKELQQDLSSEGYKMLHFAYSNDKDRDRNLAFLSNIPFVQSKAHERIFLQEGQSQQQVLRGLLEVEVNVNNQKLKLFNLHLKSRHTTKKDDPNGSRFRQNEARALINLISQNTNNGSIPHLVLGDFNDYPQSPTLLLFQNDKINPLKHIIAKDKQGNDWTHYYRKENIHSTLDYILHSINFPFSIIHQEIYSDRYYYKASDHRPIYIDIE